MAKAPLQWITSIVRNPMVERRRIRALARAVRWQVGKRLGMRRALVTVGPAQLFCYPGYMAASGTLYTGFMEYDEMSFVVRFLRADSHFIDIGANVGTVSVMAATFVPGVRVTSVEPDQATRAKLAENLQLNGLPSARVIGDAIGARPGTARFSTGRDSLNSFSSDSESIEIAVTTLDLIAAGDLPDLVKIDVEGAELGVFDGAERTLSSENAPTFIFEMNGLCARFGVEPLKLYDHLTSRGFCLLEYDGQLNALHPFAGRGIPESKCLVATKDVESLRSRISSQWSSDELKSVPIRASLLRARNLP